MSSYVVVDFEMCNIPRSVKRGRFPSTRELIEIGAVLLDESLAIADSYKSFVAPQYGMVDTYIHNLTGITRASTEAAPDTKSVLEAFAAWLPEDAVLVSWSGNDKTQLMNELEGKGLDIPKIAGLMDSWIDCQRTFSEKMDNPRDFALSEALIIANIDYEDGAHDALVDAHNTALLFAKMESGQWELNPYYEELGTKSGTMVYNPFAELFGKIGCAIF